MFSSQIHKKYKKYKQLYKDNRFGGARLPVSSDNICNIQCHKHCDLGREDIRYFIQTVLASYTEGFKGRGLDVDLDNITDKLYCIYQSKSNREIVLIAKDITGDFNECLNAPVNEPSKSDTRHSPLPKLPNVSDLGMLAMSVVLDHFYPTGVAGWKISYDYSGKEGTVNKAVHHGGTGNRRSVRLRRRNQDTDDTSERPQQNRVSWHSAQSLDEVREFTDTWPREMTWSVEEERGFREDARWGPDRRTRLSRSEWERQQELKRRAAGLRQMRQGIFPTDEDEQSTNPEQFTDNIVTYGLPVVIILIWALYNA
jgi:hypothetical protein